MKTNLILTFMLVALVAAGCTGRTEPPQPVAVTYQEDKTRMTDKKMGRAMAIINNLVISLINSQGYSNHAQARRQFNASPDRALALICGL
jgi:uncharacterized membrane protein